MSITERTSPLARDLSRYAELAGEIRRLGLLQRRPGFYVGLLTANLFALAMVVTAMVLLRNSWWLMMIAAAFAVVSAQIGFFGHDTGHRQVARRARPSRVLGLFHANLLNRLSYGWWVDKHNAHHAHPNDLDADPDVHPGILVFDAEHAAGRRGAAAWLTRHQAWLFFPLLLFEALSLHVSSVRALLRHDLRARDSSCWPRNSRPPPRCWSPPWAGCRRSYSSPSTRACWVSTSAARSRPTTRACRHCPRSRPATRCCARC